MKPSNEFTTPDQRFFFPYNNEAECHESVYTPELPGIIRVDGRYHYVVVEKADGKEEAYDPYFNSAYIPAGAVIKQIAAVRPEHTDANLARSRWLEPSDFHILDRDGQCYSPKEDDQIMVRLEENVLWQNEGTEGIPYDGIFILPAHKPLPSAQELGLRVEPRTDGRINYEFIGFINSEDKLVVPNYLSNSPMQNVVDWCIANKLTQNRLEQALLVFDLPSQNSLLAMLQVNPQLSAYIRYYDQKHDTNFMPSIDPKNEQERFPDMTGEQRDRYFFLIDAAHSFIDQPGSRG